MLSVSVMRAQTGGARAMIRVDGTDKQDQTARRSAASRLARDMLDFRFARMEDDTSAIRSKLRI